MTLPDNYPNAIRRKYTHKIGEILRQYAPTLSIPEIVYPAGLAYFPKDIGTMLWSNYSKRKTPTKPGLPRLLTPCPPSRLKISVLGWWWFKNFLEQSHSEKEFSVNLFSKPCATCFPQNLAHFTCPSFN